MIAIFRRPVPTMVIIVLFSFPVFGFLEEPPTEANKRNGDEPQSLPLEERENVRALAFSPDSKILASGNMAGVVRLWDVATGKELVQFDAQKAGVSSLAFSPNGKTLVSAGWGADSIIRLWEVPGGKFIREIGDPKNPVTGVAFSNDGKRLASSAGGGVSLWDVANGTLLRHWPFKGAVDCVAFSPDGAMVAAGTCEASVVIWHAATGQEIRRLLCPVFNQVVTNICTVAFSPDGRTVAAGGMVDPTVYFWETATGGERLQLNLKKKGQVWPRSLSFSADSKEVLVGVGGGTLWDLATGAELRQWGGIGTTVFSPDGRIVAGVHYGPGLGVLILHRDIPKKAAPAKVLSSRELNALWDDLAREDSAKAYEAICKFIEAPIDAIPFLQERHRPAASFNIKRITRLINELDSDQIRVRDQAMKELGKIGALSDSALRKVLDAEKSPDLRRKIENLLEQVPRFIPSPEILRSFRAVEILEKIGNPDARKVLKALAEGALEARLTQEAKGSLKRLHKQAREISSQSQR